MKSIKFIFALLAMVLMSCTPSMLSTSAPTPLAVHTVAANRTLRHFARSNFTREPRHIVMTDAQMRALPGYKDAVDATGRIRTTGTNVIAVVGANAPPKAGAVTPVVSPILPTDGVNYHSTASMPLVLPTGPSIHDIHQGQTADCYFLAPLAAIAFEQPQNVPLQIVQEATDQYRCRFYKTGADVWLRLNSQLPTNGVSQATGCNWVGVYEKGYAHQRTLADTYVSLNNGFGFISFQDLGYTSVVMSPGASTDAAVAKALASKWPVVIMTNPTIPAGVPLIGSHCEAVTGFDGSTYTIYNPWGFDGAGTDANPNDGTVSVSVAQSRSGGISSFVICTGYTAPAAFVSDTPTTQPTTQPAATTITLSSFTTIFGADANGGTFSVNQGTIIKAAWTSDADSVTYSDTLFHSSATLKGTDSWTTQSTANDTITFTFKKAGCPNVAVTANITNVPTTQPTTQPATPIVISPTQATTWTADKFSANANCKIETVNGVTDMGYVNGAAYVEFTLSVPTAGQYNLSVLMAGVAAGSADISVNGGAATRVTVPSTGSWTAFVPVATAITLPVGNVTLRISNVNNCQYNVGTSTLTPAAQPTTQPKTPAIILYSDHTWANSPN